MIYGGINCKVKCITVGIRCIIKVSLINAFIMLVERKNFKGPEIKRSKKIQKQ